MLPVVPNAPAAINLLPNAPLPFGANVAFMWSPSGNTFSLVLLPSNMTVIPYPLPPTGPTPSALLPWPVAAALPPVTSNFPSLTVAGTPTTSATGFNEEMTLAQHIMDRVDLPSSSPPPEDLQPTLMSRITSNLVTRLSNPSQSTPLPSRLMFPFRVPLADRLSDSNRMEVDSAMLLDPWEIEAAHLAEISDMMAAAGPLILDPIPYDNPWASPSDLEEGEVDDPMEEVEYKRTKRGKCTGHRIQNIRRRDEECKKRQRRGQGRC